MAVHPSGYYAWRAEPLSLRQKEEQRLTGLIKQSWLESGGVYGYRKITDDMRELGEPCGKHRVYRLSGPRDCALRRDIAVVRDAMAGRRWWRPIMSNSSLM